MVEKDLEGDGHMITTDAALYRRTDAGGAGETRVMVCGCGQEIGSTKRRHCPRCGCCLS
jgi:hypothetical protein